MTADAPIVEEFVGAPSFRIDPEEAQRRLVPHRVAIVTAEPSFSSEEMAERLGSRDFDGDRPLDRLRGDERERRDVISVAETMARGDFG